MRSGERLQSGCRSESSKPIMPPPIPSKKIYQKSFIFIGILISLLIGLLGYQETSILYRIDGALYDFFVVNNISPPKEDSVVIVDIDDISINLAGQWPWPRYRVAKLIDLILGANPKAIGLDIIFPEPDRTALTNIQQTFLVEFGLDLGYTGIPSGLADNDGFLGQVLSQGPVVGANYFYFDHTSSNNNCVGEGITLSPKQKELMSPFRATGVLCNIPVIAKGLSSKGFINNMADDDGILRKIPLLIDFQGSYFPNLSLATYMQAGNKPNIHISRDFVGPVFHLGEKSIPVDQQGYVYLKFNGRGKTHQYISAIDVLNNKDISESITGKIVFIGSSAAGINDIHHTAVDTQFPGVETHAVLIDNIVNDNFIRIPTWNHHIALISAILSSILITVMFLSSNLIIILVGSLLLAMLSFLASYALFAWYGIFISPTGSLLSIAVLFSVLSATKYGIEKKQAFSWYKQLANVQQVSLESMATVAETRDPETGAHIKRTQHYARILATWLKRQKKYEGIITDEYLETLFISAPLHDIGKVGVPDNILLKPGKLTDEEFSIMKKHAEYGHRIIITTANKIKGDNFLTLAGEIAISHHEKWNGSGYPNGLSAEDIPLSGRILAVADVYDALISVRCYKPSFPHAKAFGMIKKGSGIHFDPAVVEAFCASEQEIKDVAARFQDEKLEECELA